MNLNIIDKKTGVEINDLENWFLSQEQTAFPDKIEYVANYKSIVEKLKSIQDEVNAGADRTDNQTLTKHGESHIKKVIEQVSSLLAPDDITITPFEAFQLLLAIQIHDIKNAEGRESHEMRAIEIFSEEGLDKIYTNRVIIEQIGKISACHAGSVNINKKSNKDKINILLDRDSYGKGKIETDARLLASLLRLADELADETGRSYRYLAKKKLISKKSEVHHKFAESIENIYIDHKGKTIYIDFHIDPKDAVCKFGKHNKTSGRYKAVYLLDEIYERCLKSHWETIYCMRFLRPKISIDQICVSIIILGSPKVSDNLEHFINPPKIEFTLREIGYPVESMSDGLDRIKSQTKKNGDSWTGKSLQKYVVDHKLV